MDDPGRFRTRGLLGPFESPSPRRAVRHGKRLLLKSKHDIDPQPAQLLEAVTHVVDYVGVRIVAYKLVW